MGPSRRGRHSRGHQGGENLAIEMGNLASTAADSQVALMEDAAQPALDSQTSLSLTESVVSSVPTGESLPPAADVVGGGGQTADLGETPGQATSTNNNPPTLTLDNAKIKSFVEYGSNGVPIYSSVYKQRIVAVRKKYKLSQKRRDTLVNSSSEGAMEEAESLRVNASGINATCFFDRVHYPPRYEHGPFQPILRNLEAEGRLLVDALDRRSLVALAGLLDSATGVSCEIQVMGILKNIFCLIEDFRKLIVKGVDDLKGIGQKLGPVYMETFKNDVEFGLVFLYEMDSALKPLNLPSPAIVLPTINVIKEFSHFLTMTATQHGLHLRPFGQGQNPTVAPLNLIIVSSMPQLIDSGRVYDQLHTNCHKELNRFTLLTQKHVSRAVMAKEPVLQASKFVKLIEAALHIARDLGFEDDREYLFHLQDEHPKRNPVAVMRAYQDLLPPVEQIYAILKKASAIFKDLDILKFHVSPFMIELIGFVRGKQDHPLATLSRCTFIQDKKRKYEDVTSMWTPPKITTVSMWEECTKMIVSMSASCSKDLGILVNNVMVKAARENGLPPPDEDDSKKHNVFHKAKALFSSKKRDKMHNVKRHLLTFDYTARGDVLSDVMEVNMVDDIYMSTLLPEISVWRTGLFDNTKAEEAVKAWMEAEEAAGDDATVRGNSLEINEIPPSSRATSGVNFSVFAMTLEEPKEPSIASEPVLPVEPMIPENAYTAHQKLSSTLQVPVPDMDGPAYQAFAKDMQAILGSSLGSSVHAGNIAQFRRSHLAARPADRNSTFLAPPIDLERERVRGKELRKSGQWSGINPDRRFSAATWEYAEDHDSSYGSDAPPAKAGEMGYEAGDEGDGRTTDGSRPSTGIDGPFVEYTAINETVHHDEPTSPVPSVNSVPWTPLSLTERRLSVHLGPSTTTIEDSHGPMTPVDSIDQHDETITPRMSLHSAAGHYAFNDDGPVLEDENPVPQEKKPTPKKVTNRQRPGSWYPENEDSFVDDDDQVLHSGGKTFTKAELKYNRKAHDEYRRGLMSDTGYYQFLNGDVSMLDE